MDASRPIYVLWSTVERGPGQRMTITEDDVLFYPVLSQLPPAIVSDIKSRLRETRVKRRLFVFREGDACDSLYLLRQGRVKVSKSSSDGRELAIAILRAGDFFDIAPIFDDGPQMVSAQALDDLRLHVLGKADLLRLAAQYPSLASTLLASVFSTLRQLTGLVEQVSGKSVTARLASFLLAQTSDGKRIYLDISQREVAALVGTRREVLSRALGKLEKDGILNVTYPQITILDSERLRRLA